MGLQIAADLHMAQLMPLPLTVSHFSNIQIGFIFLVPAHPGSPRQRAVKLVLLLLLATSLNNQIEHKWVFLQTSRLACLSVQKVYCGKMAD